MKSSLQTRRLVVLGAFITFVMTGAAVYLIAPLGAERSRARKADELSSSQGRALRQASAPQEGGSVEPVRHTKSAPRLRLDVRVVEQVGGRPIAQATILVTPANTPSGAVPGYHIESRSNAEGLAFIEAPLTLDECLHAAKWHVAAWKEGYCLGSATVQVEEESDSKVVVKLRPSERFTVSVKGLTERADGWRSARLSLEYEAATPRHLINWAAGPGYKREHQVAGDGVFVFSDITAPRAGIVRLVANYPDSEAISVCWAKLKDEIASYILEVPEALQPGAFARVNVAITSSVPFSGLVAAGLTNTTPVSSRGRTSETINVDGPTRALSVALEGEEASYILEVHIMSLCYSARIEIPWLAGVMNVPVSIDGYEVELMKDFGDRNASVSIVLYDRQGDIIGTGRDLEKGGGKARVLITNEAHNFEVLDTWIDSQGREVCRGTGRLPCSRLSGRLGPEMLSAVYPVKLLLTDDITGRRPSLTLRREGGAASEMPSFGVRLSSYGSALEHLLPGRYTVFLGEKPVADFEVKGSQEGSKVVKFSFK